MQDTYRVTKCYEIIEDWAKSSKGKSITLYKSFGIKKGGEYDENLKKPILFLGGVHGDEPEGVWLAEETLGWLQECYTFRSSDFTIPWLLIPCINPDGFERNERINGNGVDLNRNFPDANWSPEFKAERYFPGPQPASEPETQALMKLIEEYEPQLIVHCHSWKPCVVLTGDRGMNCAEYLARSSGYDLMNDIGYPTPGSLGEYAWREKDIPVICLEVEEKIERSRLAPLFRNGIFDLFQNGVL